MIVTGRLEQRAVKVKLEQEEGEGKPAGGTSLCLSMLLMLHPEAVITI